MAAAIATAAGVIGAAYLSKRAQDNASKRAAATQDKATTQGLDYQKGRDTIDDQRYQKRLDLYNQYVADYRARNGGATGSGGGGGAASVGAPVSIADLVGQQQGVADASGQSGAPAGSVAAMMGGQGGVFDWSRYGA